MRWASSFAYLLLAVVGQRHAALAADNFLAIIVPRPGSEYTERLLLGAQKASRDLGVDLKYSFVAPTDNRDRQTAFLKEVIAERPAGIIVAPSAYPGIENALKEISGLPVIMGVGPVTQEEGQLSTVMTNNFVAGTLAADVLGQRAGEQEGNVAWIGSNEIGERRRADGFVQWISKQYPKLKVLSLDSGNNSDLAYKVARQFVLTSKDIKGIFSTSEESALGVGRAIEDLRKNDQIPIVGFGSTEGLMNLLDHNIITGLVAPDTYQIGYEAVILAVDRYNGKKVPAVSDVAPTLFVVN